MHSLQRRGATRTTSSSFEQRGCLVTLVTLLSPCQAMSPWHLTVSPRTLLFLATWPFVTQWLLRHWQSRKR